MTHRYFMSFWFWCLGFIILCTSCTNKNQPGCIPLKSNSQTLFQFTILDEDLFSVQLTMFAIPGLKESWEQKITYLSQDNNAGWGNWLVGLNIQPSMRNKKAEDTYHSNPIMIADQQETHGYMLIRNMNPAPYALRIIFLLDFEQVSIIYSGAEQSFYDLPVLDPNEDRGFAFTLPPLSTGFHQLSMLLISDAENPLLDQSYRLTQQAMFMEIRYDMWVGIDSLPEAVARFKSNEEGQAAQNYEAPIDYLVSPNEQEYESLHSLSASVGQKACVALGFYNSKTGWEMDSNKAPVPLRVVVFLNDKSIGFMDYQFTADTPEDLKIKLDIPMPKKTGTYQLSGIAFWYPGYSQFDDAWTRIGYFNTATFTQRIIVAIQP